MFRGMTKLETVSVTTDKTYLPGGDIREIGDYAFEGCASLTEFPGGYIFGDRAFKDCTSLTRVTLSDSYCGNQMFMGCTSLSYVDINAYSFFEMGTEMFRGCDNMIAVTSFGGMVTSLPLQTSPGFVNDLKRCCRRANLQQRFFVCRADAWVFFPYLRNNRPVSAFGGYNRRHKAGKKCFPRSPYIMKAPPQFSPAAAHQDMSYSPA